MHYGKLPDWAVRGARFWHTPDPREPRRFCIIRAVVDDVMVVARSYDRYTGTWDYFGLDFADLQHAKVSAEDGQK